MNAAGLCWNIFECTKKYHKDRRAVLDMRRVGCWYLKKSAGTRDFRGLISKAENLEQVAELIANFSSPQYRECGDVG